mmetsp:Transcript_26362/g.39939  ORF Transcript_26362/g.39939 Transcript_26362/m.39939 type:complete len:260 (-) Transcript_26362:118-897(-)|eukprot:CAMPEP_0178898414 /NCGR_PEP_ID=MMETSP0786-20121207/2317_1 /TAXON_ID=186022 /ORGANISM="Thalassionema frauenfeldii, Strain CCMP 1798" /LENGTH=259 /DNA_ID=CAMNT_0020569129 /DNA_START=107 /DNA_END=886 /DNA_ORIENTATION=+
MSQKPFTALALFACVMMAAQANDECPIVETVSNFDIDQYASAPWYSHQQAENSYSPQDQNFCVRAQYTVREESTFWGYTVDVANQDQNELGAGRDGNLCAYQTDDAKSKLAVAPCFLPKLFAGPYWIVAYDEAEGYALISGGQPNIPAYDGDNNFVGCKSGTGINNSGLWIFSRSQTRNETLISVVRDIASEKGFDLSVLNDVDHSNCDPDACTDSEETFKVWWGAEKDCDWIEGGGFFNWKCSLYGSNCPATCDQCDE